MKADIITTMGNYTMKVGDPAPDFYLPSTHAQVYSLKILNFPILVIFFTCNTCPVSLAYEKRVMKFVDEFKDQVNVIAINSNDSFKNYEDSFERSVQLAKEKELNYAYLRDEDQEVAKAYGARCTPHFFVFNNEKKLVYQGCFDDNWQDETKVTKTELKDVVTALLKGESIKVPYSHATGCKIKWRGRHPF